jgi:hypothetical protein
MATSGNHGLACGWRTTAAGMGGDATMRECDYCCCEPAIHLRVPTTIGTPADLCEKCAARYGPRRPLRRREPPAVGGPHHHPVPLCLED